MSIVFEMDQSVHLVPVEYFIHTFQHWHVIGMIGGWGIGGRKQTAGKTIAS